MPGLATVHYWILALGTAWHLPVRAGPCPFLPMATVWQSVARHRHLEAQAYWVSCSSEVALLLLAWDGNIPLCQPRTRPRGGVADLPSHQDQPMCQLE
jgi:hypothetical protein